MKLLRKILRLEAAEDRRDEPLAFGLVWSSDEHKVDPSQSPDGSHVAHDIWLAGGVEFAGVPRPGARQRFAEDPADLGLVYDAGGAAVGRVLSIDGGVIRYEVDSPAVSTARRG